MRFSNNYVDAVENEVIDANNYLRDIISALNNIKSFINNSFIDIDNISTTVGRSFDYYDYNIYEKNIEDMIKHYILKIQDDVFQAGSNFENLISIYQENSDDLMIKFKNIKEDLISSTRINISRLQEKINALQVETFNNNSTIIPEISVPKGVIVDIFRARWTRGCGSSVIIWVVFGIGGIIISGKGCSESFDSSLYISLILLMFFFIGKFALFYIAQKSMASQIRINDEIESRKLLISENLTFEISQYRSAVKSLEDINDIFQEKTVRRMKIRSTA